MSKVDQLRARNKARNADAIGAGDGAEPETTPTPNPNPGPDYRSAGTSLAKNFLRIPLDSIVADPDQPRKSFKPEELAPLIESFRSRREQGLEEQIVPCKVRERPDLGKYMLIGGETRWRAAIDYGLKVLLCEVDNVERDPMDRFAEQVQDNNLRRFNTDEEVGRAILKYMEGKEVSQNEAARQLGFSTSKASRCLAVVAMPPEVRTLIEAGSLSVSAAVALARLESAVDQNDLATRAAQGTWSRERIAEEVDSLIARRLAEAPAPPAETPSGAESEPGSEPTATQAFAADVATSPAATEPAKPSVGAAKRGAGKSGTKPKAKAEPADERSKSRTFTSGPITIYASSDAPLNLAKLAGALERAAEQVRMQLETQEQEKEQGKAKAKAEKQAPATDEAKPKKSRKASKEPAGA